jgi:hypothetical protein
VKSPAEGNTQRWLRVPEISTVDPKPQFIVTRAGPGGLTTALFGVTCTPNVVPSTRMTDGRSSVSVNGAAAGRSTAALTPLSSDAVTRATSLADSVTETVPLDDVVADDVLRVPLLVVKPTAVPSMRAPCPSVTRAVTRTSVPLRSTVVGNAVSVTAPAVLDGCTGTESASSHAAMARSARAMATWRMAVQYSDGCQLFGKIRPGWNSRRDTTR